MDLHFSDCYNVLQFEGVGQGCGKTEVAIVTCLCTKINAVDYTNLGYIFYVEDIE
jgi:hypothetical protein